MKIGHYISICDACAQCIAGNDTCPEITENVQRAVASLESQWLAVLTGKTDDFSFAHCDCCLDRKGGKRHEISLTERIPSLPTLLSKWRWQSSQRVYQGLGLSKTHIPADLKCSAIVDGFTFEVKPSNSTPKRRSAKHRIYLRMGASLIPFGRLSQIEFVLLAHRGGLPEGLFVKQTDVGAFDLYEVALWENLDSSAIATHGKYNVQSGHVNLETQASHVLSALRAQGLQLDQYGHVVSEHTKELVAAVDTFDHALTLTQCLWEHGAKDVACDVSGNNLAALIKTARNAL